MGPHSERLFHSPRLTPRLTPPIEGRLGRDPSSRRALFKPESGKRRAARRADRSGAFRGLGVLRTMPPPAVQSPASHLLGLTWLYSLMRQRPASPGCLFSGERESVRRTC